jgi:hypothetical protein
MASRHKFRINEPVAAVIVAVLLLPCLSGCGDALTSVNGIVRLDGKALSSAAITLHPVKGGPLASGTNDSDGRYRLETGNKSRIAFGEYRVTVVKKETTGFLAAKNGLSGGIAKGGIKEKWIVPKKYASPDTSGLVVHVKSGMEPMKLVLELH